MNKSDSDSIERNDGGKWVEVGEHMTEMQCIGPNELETTSEYVVDRE